MAHNHTTPVGSAEASAYEHLRASAAAGLDAETMLALDVIRAKLAVPAANTPLPSEIVWMPAGTHEISAFAKDGSTWRGTVICDQVGADQVAASFASIKAQGRRVRLDEAHSGDAATAWVNGFSWDPDRGIVAAVEWTSLGEDLVRGKVYTSFSPEFLVNKTTKRVAAIWPGRPAGGLVNEPAFGAAMPALIAARLAGAESVNPASGGSPDNQSNRSKMNKDLIIQILAALAVQVPADATDEQATALFAKHKDQLVSAAKSNAELKAKLEQLESVQAKANEASKTEHAELVALRAKDAERRKADAKAAVDAAVARGALPPKDEAIQAKWRGLIEADPNHADLLKAMKPEPALSRITQPGGLGVVARDGALECLRAMHAASISDVAGRATIYARDIAPLFKEPGFNLGCVLAANSLGALSGELITQRSLSLLKQKLSWLFKISTDFSDASVSFGQEIKTRLRTVPGVSDYTPGVGYSRQDAITPEVPVIIDQHKGVEIAFNANELGSTTRDLFGEQAEGGHYALGYAFASYILALITKPAFPNESVEAVADVSADTMDALDAALTTRGVIGPRVGLLSSLVYRRLGKDTSIVTLAGFQMKEIITEGTLPPIKNIQPYEVIGLPVANNLTGFACTPDALAFATRLPNDYTKAMPDVPSNGVIQTVKNPDTGISVALVRYIDHKAAVAAWRVAVQFGAAKGNPASGQRLVSAATS